MRDLSLIVAAAVLLTGCVGAPAQEESRRFAQMSVQVDRQASGIDISNYTLISDDAARDHLDATEIMRVKADWPRAMQTKSKELFESILARNFTFRAEDEWFERDAYIRDRVESVETVDSARYENLVLQFFGEVAVLTYRNVVAGTDGMTGLPEAWHYSWADVYVREDGKWKIGGSHQISGHADATRRFGRQIVECHFVDDDQVPVSVTLNVDTNGVPFEVDVWKVDFGSTIRWPLHHEIAQGRPNNLIERTRER